MMQNNLALYIHIPFCKQKCSYCAFTSFPAGKEKIKAYFNALLKEVELTSVNFKEKIVDTIYIGGGTPSYVEAGYIKKLLAQINQHYTVRNKAEITIEVNPDSVTKEKLEEYKKAGINRLSIGSQTTSDRLLKLINRPHTSKQFFEAVTLAKEVGFTNINADLILSLPTQTLKDVKKSAKDLAMLNLTHISAYDLVLEEETALYKQVKEGFFTRTPEKLSLKMQHYVVKYLKKHGFNRYEVSAYSKKGYESRHNLKYWNLEDYLGLGLNSHSKIFNIRFHNTENLEQYIQTINSGKLEYEDKQTVSKKEQLEEYVMLSLRKQEGIDLSEFEKLFGYSLLEQKQEIIEDLLKNKLIKIKDGYLFATLTGFDVLNSLIVSLI